MPMSNDAAITWLRKHAVVAIFHEDKIILALPYRQLDVTAFSSSGFKLEIKRGFALAYTEPGDGLGEVVEAARGAWREKLPPIDAALDASGQPGPRIPLSFQTDL